MPIKNENLAEMPEFEKLLAKLSQEERDRPTLKTISRLTGFSVPTVSRALSDAPDIRIKTKTRVRETAERLGYRRDRAAVRLRTGKTNVVALALNTENEVMHATAKLISSIAITFRGTAYHLIVVPYFDDEDPLDAVRYVVRTGSADGIIINQIEPDDPRVTYLRERNFPFALHGRTQNVDDAPFCDFDNEMFAGNAVSLMQSRGRSNFLLLAPPPEQNYAISTIDGARNVCKREGLNFQVMEDATSDDTPTKIQDAVMRALKEDPTIDAVLTASVPAAMGIVAALEDAGRRLGKDIDLAAKEAFPFLKAFRKEILVTTEDIGTTGQFLAEAMINRIEAPTSAPMQRMLAPSPFE